MPGRDAALFLDLDGTLLEFAATPGGVVVPAHLRDLLVALRSRFDGALAILSGRPLADIDALLGVHDLAAAGIHGSDWRGHADRQHIAPASSALDDVRRHLDEALARTPDLRVEDKGIALALHFRASPQAAPQAASLAIELLRIAGSGFALQHGNQVIELRPANADKGSALKRFMSGASFRGRKPWMVGDDFTDESAFVQANADDGESVIVGSRRPTAARCALRDPAAVLDWLDRTRNAT